MADFASLNGNLIDLLRDPNLIDFFKVGPRQFNYSAPVAASDTGCQQTFNSRQFVHHDWVDGQDMVQAGRSADNDGFNFLFHNLETDLDAAKTDIATLFACGFRLRQQLVAALNDIRSELNRIDSDIWSLTPNKGLTGPSLGTLVGVTQLQGKNLAILRNEDGSLVSMALDQAVNPAPSTLNDRVGNAAALAQFLAASPDAASLFANGKTAAVSDVIAKVGGQTLSNGKKVSDVLSVVPAGTTFKSTTDISNAVSDSEAAVVKSSSDAAASRAALGVTTGSAAGASIANVGVIDSGTRAKLNAAGINTVSDLSNADPAKLTASGAATNAADAARLVAIGRTLRGIS